jgi:hypothetical protein
MEVEQPKLNTRNTLNGGEKYRALSTTAYLKFDGLTTHQVSIAKERFIFTYTKPSLASGNKSKPDLNTLLSHFLPNIERPFLGLFVR